MKKTSTATYPSLGLYCESGLTSFQKLQFKYNVNRVLKGNGLKLVATCPL